MGRKQKIKDGFEWDWISNWRKRGIIRFNAGVGKYIKRRLNKRMRRDGKKDAIPK